MTSFSVLPQLLLAACERLRTDGELQLLATAVYDEAPEKPLYPHLVLDDPFETPNRTFAQNGHDATLTVSIYTQTPATTKVGKGKAGFMLGLQIAERVCALLTDIEDNPLEVNGHDVIDADVLGVEGFREPDGKTRRVDVTVSYTVETRP